MIKDPIVEEIHETRRRLLERFDGDLDKYLDHLREMEKQHPERLVDSLPRKEQPAAKRR